ncbi:MAG TPA: hypothetical protein PLW86_15530 [Rhodocyclaceae bacterium]|nr:hypothetical protein [Rhodocyclaceae bacterium]
MNQRTILAMLALAATLAGCAGSDFVRPAEGLLVVGKSTTADVTARMGAPMQTGELTKNDKKLKLYRYAYASTGGESAHPGVTPARSMAFSFHEDKLVSQEFVSSFKQDSSDFDSNKMSAIVKGKSTRDEVIALLGRPAGEAVYPIIKGQTDKALVYSYTHAKGSVFNMKFYSKILIVSFNNQGIVSDIEFTTAGDQ